MSKEVEAEWNGLDISVGDFIKWRMTRNGTSEPAKVTELHEDHVMVRYHYGQMQKNVKVMRDRIISVMRL